MRGPPVRRGCCRPSRCSSRSPSWRRVRHRGDPDTAPSTSPATELDPSDDLDDEIDEPIAPNTGLAGGDAPTSDQVVKAALIDVERVLGAHLRGPLRHPVPADLRRASGPTAPTPSSRRAASRPPSYEDIAENAFYCPAGDLIAWDDVEPHPGPLRRVRRLHPRHRVRPRVRPRHPDRAPATSGDTVHAGAPGRLLRRRVGPRRRGGQLRVLRAHASTTSTRRVAGFLALRDGVGTAAADPAAHGTGFDRIGSFVDGYELGVEHCAGYPDAARLRRAGRGRGALHTTPGGLRAGRQPAARPSSCRRSLEDLENFWTHPVRGARGWSGRRWRTSSRSTPTPTRCDCGGETYSGDVLVNASFYCVDDDTIYIDDVNLIPALNEIGDYAVATEIARQYAYAAQVRLGHRREHARHQPPRRLPHRRLRVERLRRRPAGHRPGALPLPRRPRRGRHRVPAQQRRQRGRRGRRRVRRHRLPALRRLPRRLPRPAPTPATQYLDEG